MSDLDTDPLRSQLVVGCSIFVFAAKFASVIPLNNQTSGEKSDRNLPVMFGRRIAKLFANPQRRAFTYIAAMFVYHKISTNSLAQPNFVTGAIM